LGGRGWPVCHSSLAAFLSVLIIRGILHGCLAPFLLGFEGQGEAPVTPLLHQIGTNGGLFALHQGGLGGVAGDRFPRAFCIRDRLDIRQRR